MRCNSGPNPVGAPSAVIGLATKWFVWLTLWYSTGGRYWLYLFRNTIRRDLRQVAACQYVETGGYFAKT